MHSTILFEPSPSAGNRWFSITSATWSVLNTAMMMQRAGAASSAMLFTARPPISFSRARRAGSMSKPTTGIPASSSRLA